MLRTVRSRALMALSLLASMLTLLPAGAAGALTSDLIISEYVEGSSFNKVIEIYNGTGATVDLAGYDLELYSNGSTSATGPLNLAGNSIADGEVFVVAHPDADAAILAVADLTSNTVINFNGDDAVVLRYAGGGAIVDSFGQVGVDPGSQWTGGGQDDTLRRKADVCAGDTIADDAFDASAEWDVFAIDTFDGLGSHTANCDAGSGLGSLSISKSVVGDVPAGTTFTIVATCDATPYEASFGETGGTETFTDIAAGTVCSFEETVDGGATSVDIPADVTIVEDATVTATVTNSFAAPVAYDVVISEVMYDPPSDEDNWEWIEIYNAGADAIDLTDWVVDDINNTAHGSANIAGGSLPAGGSAILFNVDDVSAGDFAAAWGSGMNLVPVTNWGAMALNNGGDTIGLWSDFASYTGDQATHANAVVSVAYDDLVANSASVYLTDLADPASWAASTVDGVTPVGTGYESAAAGGNVGGEIASPGGLLPEFPLVINEVMQNPGAVDDSAGEWFEIYNPHATDVDINGWTIADDDSDSHLIDNGGPLLVPAGGFLVLGTNTDTLTNGGAPVAYSYGDSWFLSNGADEIVLYDLAGAEADRIEYDGGAVWPDPTGASMALDDPALNNNNGANWCTSTAAFGDGDLGTPGADNGGCAALEPTAYFIHEIQGSGLESPVVGEYVRIEGVVVGDFQGDAFGDDQLNGFFVQEEDGDADGDSATSEGIFVYAPGAVDVAMGDVVEVIGFVSEFDGLTEISADDVVITGSGATATAAVVSLPMADATAFEQYEGMAVTIPQTLYIAEYFNFDRFGEMVLATTRQMQPTALVEPGSPEFETLLATNLLSRITLDDGRTTQNPDPAIHPNGAVFDLTNLFRGGDEVANVTGVMHEAFDLYRIQPTQGADYTAANPRQPTPDDVGGTLKVASFNVLNYFTTLGSRGADDAEEFDRQRTKIIQAIADIDADIVGLIEIENNTEAIVDLVTGLNELVGAGTYDYVDTGVIGTDEIKVAFIYKPATVGLGGDYQILDASVDARFNDDRNRPALAQTFVESATGEAVTVVVNHLKSKGSACDDIGDPDLGDGAGNCNITRTEAAEAMADWLEANTEGAFVENVLIIGDLNSYDKEDPIDALREGADDVLGTGDDYRDLIYDYLGEFAYSYVFDGQLGYLDYAMANETLAPAVTGITVWHINADEPDLIDYDTSFKQDAQDELYEPNAFRSSDHDPVIVGLDLQAEAELAPRLAILDVADRLSELPPTGRFWDDWRIGRAIDRLERAADERYWVGDTHVTGERVYNDVIWAIRQLERLRSVDPDPYVADLVAAMADVSDLAIEEAINAGGIQWAINSALRFQDLGDDAWGDGNAVVAVRNYRKAWTRAAIAVSRPRFATFNASLNRFNAGDLVADLSTGANAQAQTIAEIIQINRPNVVLINEFDYVAGGLAADLFRSNYLEVSQNGQDPVFYPYAYVAASNTGVDSGFDLNNDGATGTADDAFGFGFFPGQYGMLVLSQHPIDTDELRTFQHFLWKDMPGALLPDDPATTEPADWYSPEELEVFRLSSKSHWDAPILVGRNTVHFLVSHPTPPTFDGDEDRNGTRNHDEIRFWADYVNPGASGYIYDDDGAYGGLGWGARFVIAGDLNSDPNDGDSIPGSAQQVLNSPFVNSWLTPSSEGGVEQAALQGGANDTHIGDPAYDTADFSDTAPGNLRVDYVLPSYNIWVRNAGVFWPLESDPYFPLVGTFPFPSSDHRMVWVDMSL